MYGTDLHTFGDLTRIRHNHHICQNCKNRQIVDDILLFWPILLLCAFLDIITIFAKIVKIVKLSTIFCYFANFVIVCILDISEGYTTLCYKVLSEE